MPKCTHKIIYYISLYLFLSCDGKCIICGSEDNYIYVWKTQHDYSKLSSVRKDRNDYFECFTGKPTRCHMTVT